MIKDILVKLERDGARDSAAGYAISVAAAFGAHVAGASFAYASIPSFVLPDVPSDVLASMLQENETEARDAVSRFEETARRAGVSCEHRLVLETEAGPPDVFATIARRFDLSVIMQSDHDNNIHNDLMIEAALFNSGRPVLIAPYIQKEGLKLGRVVCGWDGSRTSARAVNDALPFLKKASLVEIFIVATEKNEREKEMRGADIAQHLARHGVKVEIEVLPASDVEVGNIILSHTADCGADLLVMGGYGHSRLREFMLGGVTRDILESMTCPVLMSH